ncbi:MAG: tetratricopeptide repeat protein [Anaerolineae bacterium]|nr:tetratricopeptide repeat protein [Anaerolineae bacterium]
MFRQQEVATFLNEVLRLDLSPADVAALEARTEGWIAGLQVAAMAMRDRVDLAGFIAAFTGSHRHILSYLIEEVFTQQPEAVQSFLLKTSVLDRLCGALCDALTGRGDGRAMLERLERENVFVVALDDEQCWYRYHHLFQDVLCAHLQRTYAPEAIAGLHRQASGWYERGGDMAQAIQHALRIDDFMRVVAMLKDSAMDMIGAYSLTTLRGWLDVLPETLVRRTTNLSMAYAWIFLASSQPDKVEPHLQDVEHILGMTADDSTSSLAATPAARCTLAEIASIRANVAFHYSDLARVLALSQQALHYLDGEAKIACPDKYAALQGIITFNMGLAYEFSGDMRQATEQFQRALRVNRQIGNWHLIPLSASHLAQVLQVQGKLKQAAEIYRQAIQYTEEAAALPSQLSGIAHTGLGHILYEFNDLAAAEACLQQGIALAQPWTHWETLASGTLGLSQVLAAQSNWTQAHALLQDMEARIAASQAPWGRTRLQAQRAWLWIRRNELDAVKAWMQQTDLRADSDFVYLRESEFIILAHAYIVTGEPQQATHLLERLCAATVQNEYTGRAIECLALLALAQSAQSQPQAALATLRRALTLAAPEGYIRVFVDMGQPMQTLLRQLSATPSDLSPYGNILLAAFPQTQLDSIPQPTIHPPQPLIDPLSERELELLHLIATGMTNRAIAEKLVVSINTVKTHARNIYGKLDVGNRTEAVAKARALDLI